MLDSDALASHLVSMQALSLNTRRALLVMSDTVARSVRGLKLRQFVETHILSKWARRPVRRHEYLDVAKLICRWVARNIHVVYDPRGVEYIQTPEALLNSRTGDCDDIAVLIAALLQSVGFRTLWIVKPRIGGGGHVYVRAFLPDGTVIECDPMRREYAYARF